MPTIDGEYVESDEDLMEDSLPPPALPPPSLPPPTSTPTPTPVVSKPIAKPTSKSTTTTKPPSTKTKTTFTTSSNTRQKKSRPMASSPRLERLYSSHKLTQEKMKKKRQQAAAHPECTFSPKLNKPRRKKNNGNNNNSSGVNRFDRLYHGAAITKAKIAKKREQVHDEHCTFTPKTNRRRSGRTSSSSSNASSANSKKKGTTTSLERKATSERLYNTAKVYEQRKQEARQSLGMEECTFSPKLNPRQPKTERKELYDYEDIIVAQSMREQQKVENELEGCTFSPEINSRSRSMEGSPDSLTVGERLYANAIERNLRKEKAEIDAKIKEER